MTVVGNAKPMTAADLTSLQGNVETIGPDADHGGGWWGNDTVARLLATIDALQAVRITDPILRELCADCYVKVDTAVAEAQGS